MMRIQTISTSVTLLMAAIVLAAPLVTNAILSVIREPAVIASHETPEHPHAVVQSVSEN